MVVSYIQDIAQSLDVQSKSIFILSTRTLKQSLKAGERRGEDAAVHSRAQPCTAAHVQAGFGQTGQPPHTTTGRLTVETATFQTPIRGADMLLLVFSLSRHKKSEIYVHCQLLLCRPQPSQERSTPQLITFTKTNISSAEGPIPLF